MEAQHNTQDRHQYDVIIAGAGMVGAAIGCALGHAGLQVALVDPIPATSYDNTRGPDLRVSALSPATVAFLDAQGAWHNIKAMRLCPYRKMAVWEKLQDPLSHQPMSSRFNQTLFDCREVNTQELGFIVENSITQWGLHQVLAELPNVKLFSPAKPVAIQHETDDTIKLVLDTGVTLQGQLLIGADGANSFVREHSHIGLVSEDYEQRAMVVTVEIPVGHLDITWQAFTATGPLALLPLPPCDNKHYASLVWYNLPENIDRLMAMDDQALLESMRQHFPDELPEIIKVVERGSFPLTRRQASSYIKKRVVLVGDAAHTINPLAGQGVNLGFQDAAALSKLLIEAYKYQQDIGSPELLSRYQQKRRPENIRMQRIMDLFYYLFSNETPPLKMVRNLGLTLAGRFPFGRKKIMRYAMGLESGFPWQ